MALKIFIRCHCAYFLLQTKQDSFRTNKNNNGYEAVTKLWQWPSLGNAASSPSSPEFQLFLSPAVLILPKISFLLLLTQPAADEEQHR